MFVLIQILVLTVSIFAEETRMSPGDIKLVLCEEDYAEIAAMAMECMETADYSFFQDTEDCFTGVKEETPQGLKDYYCSHEVEDLEKEEDCATQWLEENGRGEEILNMKKHVAHCVIEKMNSNGEQKEE
ncbi:uncharacterized protein LOC129964174 [Argiope bruennichi]|uniref:uncharacterized protein LOC129964174 n=1 Tax=Argiope bruennichi TaxID=94029 RepID=UPI00249526F3|nr:uncharacterized protein LOC129964174 [Argiope bruennichi]